MSQSIFSVLRYDDARAAIAWLERALGAEVHALHEGPDGGVGHAELRVAGDLVMLGDAGGPLAKPPGGTAVYVAVDDVDALFARARDAGAEVLAEPFDTAYGSRDLSIADPEGNVWSFGTYRPA